MIFRVCISVLVVNIAKTDNIVNILTIWEKKNLTFFLMVRIYFHDLRIIWALVTSHWKDKGSGKGYKQTEAGGRISAICALILKKTRIEELQGLIFVFRTVETFNSAVAAVEVCLCVFDFI